jgi:hypothetical protein
MSNLVKRHINKLSSQDLNSAVDMVGFKAEKHWKIDDAFLDCHTKPELKELAFEHNINVDTIQKTGDMKEAIKACWKKGSVPKSLIEKKRK